MIALTEFHTTPYAFVGSIPNISIGGMCGRVGHSHVDHGAPDRCELRSSLWVREIR